MMKNKKWLALLMTAALVPFAFAGCNNGTGGEGEGAGEEPPAVEGDTSGEDTSTKFTGKIYVVGDSTVCDYSVSPQKMDNRYINRYGYGTQLYNYLNLENANQVVNLAISGRSSLSYITDESGYYNRIKSEITAGDYLIVGFGHNDSKSDSPDRFTDARGTYDTEKAESGSPSFSYNLYKNYVQMAEEKGATAIICTPIVRYDKNNTYTGSVVHNTDTGDYAEAIRVMGKATGTTVVDLTELTKKLYMSDNTEAAYFHSHSTYDGTKPNETPSARDDTHLNMYGAKAVAYQFATAIKETDCLLKNYVKTNISAPTHEKDYPAAINTDYEKPPYSAFNPSSATKLTTTTTESTPADWYGTYMGNVSANGYTATFANDKFTVGNDGDASGKFQSSSDGFGAAFIQIPLKDDFTASADVKVIRKVTEGKTISNNQSGFGMMLRDDIYVNTKLDNLASNYVTAGILGDGSAVLFNRVGATLAKQSLSNKLTVDVGSTYTVSIKRVGQEVTCFVSDGSHDFSKKFTDISFVDVDSEYMYLCLFANRGIVCEFSNVSYKVTGVSQGA